MWQEWESHPVTKASKESQRQRLRDLVQQLIGPSNDRDFDQFIKGMIRGYDENLNVNLVDETEEEVKSEV